MANCECTFIAIKPDGVQQGLVGEIIKRFEQKRFRLVGVKFMQASEDVLKEHYIDLKDRPFFVGLVKYMHSGPVVAMVHILHGWQQARRESSCRKTPFFKNHQISAGRGGSRL
uniref:Nucleoside diphosphate kinase A n=1 Tax=Piliocolobus tephrosceles TaxID=591936 RepID=A0A8C9IAN3_9PRIM